MVSPTAGEERRGKGI